jgi:hypothetical protein
MMINLRRLSHSRNVPGESQAQNRAIVVLKLLAIKRLTAVTTFACLPEMLQNLPS